MVLGHYAAAFLARPHLPTAPFWLLLLAANLSEFLWLLLALAGVEPTKPDSILDATFNNLDVHMTYSHNVVPNLVLGAAVFGIVQVGWKNARLALACMLLTWLHVWCDFIVGFQHELLGPESMKVGLNSYGRFPYAAIFIEWFFALACLTYFVYAEKSKGRTVPRKKVLILYSAFTVGILAWLPNAYTPMRQLLGL
ncbi:MAG: hypothetical protein ACOY5B_14055 [Spirochaetota bacterium]